MSVSIPKGVAITEDILSDTKNLAEKISQKIKANEKENRYLERLLKNLTGMSSENGSDTKILGTHHAELNLKMQLAQLAREHGIIPVSKLPELFKAKGWTNGGTPESLKALASVS